MARNYKQLKEFMYNIIINFSASTGDSFLLWEI